MSARTSIFSGTAIICTTALGSGMFVLPIIFAQNSMMTVSLILAAYCLSMTIAALVMIEISIRFPTKGNIHSIASKALGRYGSFVSGIAFVIVFTFVIYSSICGLIELVKHLNNTSSSFTSAAIIITCLLSFIALSTGEISKLGYANATLWLILFTTSVYALFQYNHPEAANLENYKTLSFEQWSIIMPICQACFCFHAILPSIVKRYGYNKSRSTKSIFFAMPIIYATYLAWVFSVRETIPKSTLDQIIQNSQSTQGLISEIAQLHSPFFSSIITLLYFVAIFTSLTGISIAALDFTREKLALPESTKNNLLALSVMFFIPMIMYTYNSDGFIYGIQTSVIGSTVLAIILPTLIAIKSRRHIKNDFQPVNFLVIKAMLAFGVLSLLINISSQFADKDNNHLHIQINTCNPLAIINKAPNLNSNSCTNS
ncbi:aromatic amino acid transport family protein [Shewanella sp. NIFS-20-20]|uniref:aromatic amino acid transport family protein n=1 Tax=Shewanella sp. NIFS-20-20 TaxID=2853806 RepID=UPI001C4735A6|nr:aromatic amino acid transport family protein [Shewanella sp. NIFS-20-20]MBV7317577.1 hypothetical protein [Shewanella sp. NIFS-20-20]